MTNEDKRKEQIAEIDRLYQGVKSFRSAEAFNGLLKVVKKFRGLSPYNAMLISLQKPGSAFVATASDWEDRFERFPKPGARPLVILHTFGPIAFVYDVADTEGKEFPEILLEPFKTNEVVTEKQFMNLKNSLIKEGIRYSEEDYGSFGAGRIMLYSNFEEKTQKSGIFTKTQQGYFKDTLVWIPATVAINKNLSLTEKFATILHEVAHLECGHFGAHPILKWVPQGRNNLSENTREFEAETVSWIICNRLGIECKSEFYLHSYLDDHGNIPEDISIDSILKAAGIIEKMILNKNQIRESLRVEKRAKKKPGWNTPISQYLNKPI